MKRRYSLKRSDNYPVTTTGVQPITGDGSFKITTGFPVTSALITHAAAFGSTTASQNVILYEDEKNLEEGPLLYNFHADEPTIIQQMELRFSRHSTLRDYQMDAKIVGTDVSIYGQTDSVVENIIYSNPLLLNLNDTLSIMARTAFSLESSSSSSMSSSSSINLMPRCFCSVVKPSSGSDNVFDTAHSPVNDSFTADLSTIVSEDGYQLGYFLVDSSDPDCGTKYLDIDTETFSVTGISIPSASRVFTQIRKPSASDDNIFGTMYYMGSTSFNVALSAKTLTDHYALNYFIADASDGILGSESIPASTTSLSITGLTMPIAPRILVTIRKPNRTAENIFATVHSITSTGFEVSLSGSTISSGHVLDYLVIDGELYANSGTVDILNGTDSVVVNNESSSFSFISQSFSSSSTEADPTSSSFSSSSILLSRSSLSSSVSSSTQSLSSSKSTSSLSSLSSESSISTSSMSSSSVSSDGPSTSSSTQSLSSSSSTSSLAPFTSSSQSLYGSSDSSESSTQTSTSLSSGSSSLSSSSSSSLGYFRVTMRLYYMPVGIILKQADSSSSYSATPVYILSETSEGDSPTGITIYVSSFDDDGFTVTYKNAPLSSVLHYSYICA